MRRSVAVLAVLGCAQLAHAGEEEPAKPAKKSAPAPIAGWVPGEGFRLQSTDGNWRLRVGLQVAIYYQPFFENAVADWNNFGFAYARPRVSGFLLRPWFEYWCSIELRNF